MAYLKHCPICGREAALYEAVADRIGYYCECYECAKSTDEFATEKEAEQMWNRSEAKDLKDTGLRGMYAIVMKPFYTWEQFFCHLLLLLGPVAAVTIIFTLKTYMNTVLYIGTSLGGLFCMAIVLYFSFQYFLRFQNTVRRLPPKERRKNLIAAAFACITVLCAYIVLTLFVLIPFIRFCRSGKAFLN